MFCVQLTASHGPWVIYFIYINGVCVQYVVCVYFLYFEHFPPRVHNSAESDKDHMLMHIECCGQYLQMPDLECFYP